ncbi:hypothetical protein JVT61DRAFT_2700 [Boletus reticuloceps]|uniref:Uncharacterized protein n=1 Tax=Boletus reticuloceps TaxID=495285 RepID=A0A8I3A8J8_9AGAM|nr:hypothetical protein JVT61DRAFT_2700 [Boletus reticuloceps]
MSPPTDLEQVVNAEIKYVSPALVDSSPTLPTENGISNNAEEHDAALELRDAVLRLRRDGAFVAVPLFRVNTAPIGPHPVGERLPEPLRMKQIVFQVPMRYGSLPRRLRPSSPTSVKTEVISASSFILLHAKRESGLSLFSTAFDPIFYRDHDIRNAWIGPSFALDLSTLPVLSEKLPLQYPSLKLGYSAPEPDYTLEERRRIGANVERVLRSEKEAARAPSN